MRVYLHAAAAMASLSIFSPPAQAAEPTPLIATSKWQMDYAPTECRLLRSFGDGNDRVTIQLSQIAPDPEIEVALAGRRIPTTAAYVPATLSTTTVRPVTATAQGFAAHGPSLSSLRIDPNPALRDAIASDVTQGKPTRLGVSFTRNYAVALDMGAMKAPLAALDSCMDDLVRTWGLDPAEQRARRSAPEPVTPPAKWFSAADFPFAMFRAAAGALVVTRLTVSVDGAVSGCTVAKAGGDEAFEDLTCRLITKRARFTPALGGSGRPIASYWAVRVKWQPADSLLTSAGQ